LKRLYVHLHQYILVPNVLQLPKSFTMNYLL
jgi:hypothetical protein